MGRYDAGGDCIRRHPRDDSRGDPGGAGFFQGGGDPLCYHAGDPFLLDGTDADRQRLRTDRSADQRNPADSSVAVSPDSQRTSGTGADCGELYCECAGPRLGGDTGGAEGHGGA